MQSMTDQNLRAALAGESQAHIKYLAFAEQARRDGKPNVARLFEAAAFSEQTHAIGHLRALGEVGDTAKNVQAGLGGETFEIDQMYPAYDAVAKLQDEGRAARSIGYALSAEKIHQVLYKQTLDTLAAGGDRDELAVYVCPVCGHTVVGGVPDNCPVCNAKGASFKKF